MNEAPLVAVVILNWNGKKFLEQFLNSVIASTYSNFQVIVADNGSTDDSVSFLRKSFQDIRVIELTQNFGFTKGYNEALKQVQADYYVLLNSDVEVMAGWIDPMVKLLEQDPLIAACQPKLLSYHERNKFEYAGAAGGWIDNYGYPFSKGRVFEYCEVDQGQYQQTEPIFWASGAALFIRARLFHQVNGFDEYFFAHQEEIDLCWRLQLAGYKIYSCPEAVVYHVGGGTLPRGNSRKTYLNFRNNLVMLAKNLPFTRVLWVIPIRIMLDAIAALKSLFTGDAGNWWAILKAHLGFIKWIFSTKGVAVHKGKKQDIRYGWLKRSVVWLHFIRKKNTFSEILRSTD